MAAKAEEPAQDDLLKYDEEEVEERGKIRFPPAREALPKTKHTEELQKQRIEKLRKKKEDAERLLQQRMEEEKERRKKEQQAKRQQQMQEQRRRDEERKRREEEEQRKKMEGGLDHILDALQHNTSKPFITVCGIELGSVRFRLLTQSLEKNESCQSIDLSRKALCDKDGVELGSCLKNNQHLEKLECEGNNLGVKAAQALAEALRSNETLRSINVEGNNLTASGNEQTGIIELAEALKENKTLRVLQLAKNGINGQGGEALAKAIEANESLMLVDLSGNDPTLSVEQLRRIDVAVRRNCERRSGLRRAERRERFALYNEEFKSRQHVMQTEAARLELEAREERRLNRMKARFESWGEEVKRVKRDEDEAMEGLISEAQDRAEASKGKKGKKGKKK